MSLISQNPYLYLIVAGFTVTFSSGAWAAPGDTELISVPDPIIGPPPPDSSGVGETSDDRSISASGRFVAFFSPANYLVPGDTNNHTDIFLRDRLTQTTTRVSVGSGGVQADGGSHSPAISANGRFVAFISSALNLYPGKINHTPDVFVHDRLTGSTQPASVGMGGEVPNEGSSSPSISADGRFVAFVSFASNLVPGDTFFTNDIFVHDRLTQTTTRINDSAHDGREPSISGNGRYVAYTSSAGYPVQSVVIYDRRTGTSTRIMAADGSEPNHVCYDPAISGDGRYVSFTSPASNLVEGDVGNGAQHIYVYDRISQTTRLVSKSSNGLKGDSDSFWSAISGNGRRIAFSSHAANLVANDSNGAADVFVHDLITGVTTLESVSSDGTQGVLESLLPSLNGDGRQVAFSSLSPNLTVNDYNFGEDVFVHEH